MVDETPTTGTHTHDRHASWMELFFDLVAVAGIGQLTHLLHHGPSFGDLALYMVLYLAFWTAWACITMYGDIAGQHAHPMMMLASMLGLGVMAAAVAGVPDRHSTTFAAVYVVVRVVLGQVWGHGRIVVDWPTAQLTVGVTPWIVSLWVPEPWKYWLWAAGLAIDLWLMFAVTGDRILARAQEELDRRLSRSHRFDDIEPPKLKAMHADPEHLGERLGLYIIIVLGEGVITVINAVGAEAWTFHLLSLGLGAFLILAGLWANTLLFGTIPRLMSGNDPADRVPWQHVMATHCWVTGVIAMIAAGLGMTIEHADGQLSAGIGWTLCGGTAAYFAIIALSSLRGQHDWRTLFAVQLPCILIAVVLGVFAPHTPAPALVYGIVALITWALLWQTWTNGKWRKGSGPDRPHRTPRRNRARTTGPVEPDPI
ncbi:low temperature requirement protein A [Nocardia sp. NBC_00511]|uniref:low temperature requirement protein A n=1 Tax=Nocardia sp. NBC_00511 TaxID=2903591 RepID=UPI0030DE9126